MAVAPYRHGLAGRALQALPELEFDFVKIEAVERLDFGLSRKALPKRELTVKRMLHHTILRKFRSTSVHPLGGGPN
jgi:hypothetical protein